MTIHGPARSLLLILTRRSVPRIEASVPAVGCDDADVANGNDERALVAGAFDQIGELEWERLDATLAGRVSFEQHRRWLDRHHVRGRVLEIGAGAGRFTVELVEAGCQVAVADISSGQLALNRQHVAAAGASDGVESWTRADVCDLPADWQGGFDAVVAYGGVLSYVFDAADVAVRQCLQALAPGGVVVGSVMSLAGNARLHVNEIAALASGDALDAVDRLVRDGDQRVIGATGVAAFRHFTLRRLTATIESAGGQLLDVAASNWLSLTDSAAVHQLEQHDGRGWAWLLDAEEAMCRESGTVEGGTHMLFAARSANDPPT
ncbi:MAG: class I SAM-dependent methyltransferase [Nocardioides sp.]